ncbi:DegT/DnrJ/EryC1/StrS family aminotransferase [Ornithinimicrobium pekingense]|uniref:DegT/DnrJ/EryC1/StrS family aminotransferase n=1 Tax=Ornithinimicrobium pekingense TaxID=384677 RepID=UPI0003B579E8|nr:DegT/DnrJ/EryC1/StrS family aminotransferase [Ornithinimicrobium pekingense]
MTTSTTGADAAQTAAVRRALAEASGTDAADWHLVSKARHGLLVVFRAVARHAGGHGEVVTQPFTCATAVAPIVTAGLRPRYADLDPDTMAIDPATVHRVVSGQTRAVVAQHTFGRAAPVARLRDLAPEGALLVEDAAHCLGDLGRDRAGAPAADVSVHSFGVEKMLPTRAGGAVWVNPALRGTPWHPLLTAALTALPTGGRRETVAHVVGTPARRVAGRLGGPGARALALAASAGLVDLAIMPSERQGRVAGKPAALSGPALRDVARAVPSLGRSAEHRRRIATLYRVGLAGVPGVVVPRLLDDPGVTLVRYPLLLSSPGRAEAAFAALQAEGLVPGRWYRPTLFPGVDPADFAYDPAASPVAEDVASRVLNLQTAEFVTPEAARRTVEVVRAHL